jgi:hypothetical protein
VHPGAGRALTDRWSPGPLVVAHLRKDETYAELLPDPDRHLDRPPLRAGCDQAARGDFADPGPSIEVARGKAPAARQDPTTPFNLMGHIFLNVHERNRDIS